ncbi:MAG: sugar kinase [Verrucomicrobia bacterium]|nr:sugar kinase [Verrucomicrobiota bacterium]
MSVLIVGSTALDTIATPKARRERLLGGSASHAAAAASFFAPTRMVGVVGDDFPKAHLNLFRKKGIDLEGLQRVPGKTFHWEGEYETNMNRRRTLKTELGVFEQFRPDLPPAYKRTPYVLLANIAPDLQLHVLKQAEQPRFVLADTMDLWLETAMADLKRVLRRADAICLNDTEARRLGEEENLIRAARRIHRLGPQWVIVKKGEHGALLSGPNGLFLCPAYPLDKVVDPTGAGDSFAGALIGWMSARRGRPEKILPKAMLYGAVTASFCCEGFGLTKTAAVGREQIEERFRRLKAMIRL